jgi:Flp pilus assembly pilin Flp
MFNPILRLVVATQLGLSRLCTQAASSERGQSTVEYALVLAGISVLVAAVFAQSRNDVFSKIWDTAIKAIKLP